MQRRDCDNCTHYEKEDIAALGHTDANEDDACDVCNEQMPKDEHTCEKVSGWKSFWNAFANFFRRLFGKPEICTCGEEIVKKED